MGVLLGLAAAVLYGTTDFAGGLLSRRSGSPLAVLVSGSLASTALAWVLLAVVGGQPPDPRVIGFGLAGGVASGIGTIALYRGLARGRMSVVGPVSAVGAAVLPVIVGVATGERPNPLALLGVIAALPAIALVAGAGADGSDDVPADGVEKTGERIKRGSGLTDGLIAGVAFGVMFVALARTGGRTGLWPLAFEQTGALAVVLAMAVITRTSLRQSLRDRVASVLDEVGALIATLLYYLATHAGMLSTVAVLTSLYPGVTVLLAYLITRERISPAQRTGLGLCALAVVAIAAG
jgi:uncharacterized membrane protein